MIDPVGGLPLLYLLIEITIFIPVFNDLLSLCDEVELYIYLMFCHFGLLNHAEELDIYLTRCHQMLAIIG